MAKLKTEQYASDHLEVSQLFKLLGHPGRLLIFTELCEHHELTNKDFVDKLKLSKTAVFEHVRKMKQLGILKERTVDGEQYFQLNYEFVENVSVTITKYQPFFVVFAKLQIIAIKKGIGAFIKQELEELNKFKTNCIPINSDNNQ